MHTFVSKLSRHRNPQLKQMIYLKRLFFKILGKNPGNVDMVQYWKTNSSVQAKVTKKDGATVMIMDGEKQVFPGFPRGYLLYGKLSKLKHEIKNQIFNDSWAKLENGVSEKDIARDIKKTLPKIYEILDGFRYEILPPSRMVKSVKEIHRALTKVAPEHKKFIDLITFILQEDDAYRFRVQWLVTYFGWLRLNPVKSFEKSLNWLEHAEIITDMKERIRLLRRILLVILKDDGFRNKFNAFFKECDWNKVKLSEADKYFFRGKYFKVDLDKFDY